MTGTAPTIFESFNARSLNSIEVAETFVPSAPFAQLCLRQHSLVLGPRGSGKTTLLKMLEPVALEAWEHPDAEDYIGGIDFIGVFVPFDRSWQAQVMGADGAAGLVPDANVLGKAAFSAHLYRCLVGCLLNRLTSEERPRHLRRIQMSPQQQERLACDLAALWQVRLRAASLLGLRAALSDRLREIGQLAGRLRVVSDRFRSEMLMENPALFSPFLEGISGALDAWESCLGCKAERWALAVDELELAPSAIKRELFEAMRSTDGRLLFKLALSPYDDTLRDLMGTTGPQAGQDFQEIPLWFTHKKDAEPFCRALWDGMLREQSMPSTRPQAAFGRSHFETDRSEWQGAHRPTAYGRGSHASRSFQQLAEIDATFRDYLARHGLDPKNLDRVPAEQRASEIRKIGPLVECRLFFLRLSKAERTPQTETETARRSRKRLTLYTGWETFCAVSEGNPRWFIGMVNGLLRETTSGRIRIGHGRQAEAISIAARRYRAALRTIPVSYGDARRRSRGLLSVLEVVAEFFRERQIERPFTAEPPGSFHVDERVTQDVSYAIAQALNAGALVFVPDPNVDSSSMTVSGKRYRLCYLLAASGGLMPRLARSVALSTIVGTAEFARHDILQLRLEDDA